MEEKIVPINRVSRKRRRDDMEILLKVNQEILELEDPIARQQIRETLRKVAVRFFSSPPWFD